MNVAAIPLVEEELSFYIDPIAENNMHDELFSDSLAMDENNMNIDNIPSETMDLAYDEREHVICDDVEMIDK